MKNSFNTARALITASLLLLGASALPQSQAHADFISYNVKFNSLGSLAGNTNYNLDFALSPLGTANNSTTINITNFNYGGGSGPTSLGPLRDSSAFEESFGAFTAGNSLSFDIFANYTPEAASPDVLTFGLYTGDFNFTQTSTTATRGAATGDGMSYFSIAFNGASPTINTYAGTNPVFAAPTIVATPEPSTWVMMALGVGVLGLIARRKRGEAQDSTDLVDAAI